MSAVRPLLLIETGGEAAYGLHPNAVLGALAHITLDLGLPVMMVKDAKEAAHFIAVATRREHDALERLHAFAKEHEADDETIHDALQQARSALEDLIKHPQEAHPWFDSALQHLERCHAHVIESLGPMDKTLMEVAVALSPDTGALFALQEDELMARTGCSSEVAKTWIQHIQAEVRSQ